VPQETFLFNDTVRANLLWAAPGAGEDDAMNFTGSTTFTSLSGVEQEMRRAIPLQGIALAAAGIAWIAGAFLNSNRCRRESNQRRLIRRLPPRNFDHEGNALPGRGHHPEAG
jgi:hypothetical protein